MSYFDELLNNPLPSAMGDGELMAESEDMDFDKEMKSLGSEFDADECGDNDTYDMDEDSDIDDIVSDILGDDDSDDSDDDDDDDEDDDELGSEDDDDSDDDEDDEDDEDIDSDLADLEREVHVNGSLSGSDDDHVPTSVDDPTPAKPVEGQADEDADKMLAICATPTVIDDSLTVEEAVEFIESGDADIAIAEGLILESDVTSMLSELSGDNGDFMEAAKFANPNQKYRMTKKARLRQLYELSLQIEARAHHDPYYPKIQKAYKIERTIKQGWRKRYGQLAMRRAKKYLKALMNSKSKTLKKAAKELTK